MQVLEPKEGKGEPPTTCHRKLIIHLNKNNAGFGGLPDCPARSKDYADAERKRNQVGRDVKNYAL